MKHLTIDKKMKEIWPDTRVGCLQYRVKVENRAAYKAFGKDEIKIEALPVLADKDGAIGSSTSDSERAMITEDVTEVLTLIYSFSGNDGLEKALEYGRKYLEEYAGAQNLESWIVE